MIDLQTVWVFALLFLGVALVWRFAQINQVGLRAAQRFCQQQQFQLLDQSVVLQKITPLFNGGRLCLQRLYRFEFTMQGANRYRGWVLMRGRRIVRVESQVTPDREIGSLYRDLGSH